MLRAPAPRLVRGFLPGLQGFQLPAESPPSCRILLVRVYVRDQETLLCYWQAIAELNTAVTSTPCLSGNASSTS